MRYYNVGKKEDYEILNKLMATDEYNDLYGYNLRFAILMVTTEDKDGVVMPPYNKSLPYKVKIISAKDRILKKIDVEIHIDRCYWEYNTNEMDKMAIIDGALKQLEVVCKGKDNVPIYEDDGVVKLKLKKPDMIYEGFKSIA